RGGQQAVVRELSRPLRGAARSVSQPAQRPSPIVFAQKCPYALVCLREGLLVRQKYDPEMTRSGRLAKAAAVHGQDAIFKQQLPHKILITLFDLQAREGVESALRIDAAQSRRFLAKLHGQVATGAQLE